jgi:transcriptional regulator with XRE-family HTH domain
MAEYSLGTKLRVLRAERGLTLRAAEEVTGVARHTISEAEQGIRAPHDTTLARLARGYGVDLAELLEARDDPGKGSTGRRSRPLTSPSTISSIERLSDTVGRLREAWGGPDPKNPQQVLDLLNSLKDQTEEVRQRLKQDYEERLADIDASRAGRREE